NNSWRLTLISAYKLGSPDPFLNEGEKLFKVKALNPQENSLSEVLTFFIEKEIVMKFDSENHRVIFPNVIKFKDEGNKIKKEYTHKGKGKFKRNVIDKKGVNGIWTSKTAICLDAQAQMPSHTRVAYQITWLPNEKKFQTDSIHNVASNADYIATPILETNADNLKTWGDRDIEKISS
ncbi:MAG: hypothetical protein AAGG81_07625, partial [Chlamydiota bacterium]